MSTEVGHMHDASPVVLNFGPRRYIGFLFAGTLTLVFADIALQAIRFLTGHDRVFGLNRLFDLGLEANLPSLWSAFLWFQASFWTFMTSRITGSLGDGMHRNWLWLSLIMALLAVDESVGLHEIVSALTERIVPVQGLFYYAWVIPGMAFAIVVAVAFAPLLSRLPPQISGRMILSGVIFVAGAIGVEMLEALVDQSGGYRSLRYMALVVVEEFLEMIGIILCTATILKYLIVHHNQRAMSVKLNVRFWDSNSPDC